LNNVSKKIDQALTARYLESHTSRQLGRYKPPGKEDELAAGTVCLDMATVNHMMHPQMVRVLGPKEGSKNSVIVEFYRADPAKLEKPERIQKYKARHTTTSRPLEGLVPLFKPEDHDSTDQAKVKYYKVDMLGGEEEWLEAIELDQEVSKELEETKIGLKFYQDKKHQSHKKKKKNAPKNLKWSPKEHPAHGDMEDLKDLIDRKKLTRIILPKPQTRGGDIFWLSVAKVVEHEEGDGLDE